MGDSLYERKGGGWVEEIMRKEWRKGRGELDKERWMYWVILFMGEGGGQGSRRGKELSIGDKGSNFKRVI